MESKVPYIRISNHVFPWFDTRDNDIHNNCPIKFVSIAMEIRINDLSANIMAN